MGNDVRLAEHERLVVVTGPNQGGKSTFARSVGQLFHLAALGCPVPATEARVFLPDRILTHFEREEQLDTLAGKLADELRRLRDVLDRATGASLVVVNEIFASTTVADAVALGRRALAVITGLGARCVFVTFLDELSRFDDSTVSMVGTVADDDPSRRTYRIVRRPADGRAYAHAVAAKHDLSYDRIRERVAP